MDKTAAWTVMSGQGMIAVRLFHSLTCLSTYNYNTFLRNVGKLLPDYVASRSRRQYLSVPDKEGWSCER
jgi:hypothetical protein